MSVSGCRIQRVQQTPVRKKCSFDIETPTSRNNCVRVRFQLFLHFLIETRRKFASPTLEGGGSVIFEYFIHWIKMAQHFLALFPFSLSSLVSEGKVLFYVERSSRVFFGVTYGKWFLCLPRQIQTTRAVLKNPWSFKCCV